MSGKIQGSLPGQIAFSIQLRRIARDGQLGSWQDLYFVAKVHGLHNRAHFVVAVAPLTKDFQAQVELGEG